MAIERFNTELFIKEEDSLLEYVRILAQKICPDIETTAEPDVVQVGESQAPFTFIRRYNSGAINIKDRYSQYIETENIAFYLAQLKLSNGSQLDLEKFWYLLLFVYDFSKGKCLTPENQLSETANEELSNFVALIDGAPYEQITIAVQVNGKNVLNIENELSVKHIANSCRHIPDELASSRVLSTVNRKGNTNTDWGIYFWLSPKSRLCSCT